MIYVGFESILVPEYNKKQNLDETIVINWCVLMINLVSVLSHT